MKEFELEPGEHVVRETRKHWFLFTLELLPYAIIAVAPFALLKMSEIFPSFTYLQQIGSGVEYRVVAGIWLLITWTVAWGAFTRYFLNAWILTNKRISTIKQRGFFKREVSSLLLSRVQDVTTDVSGVLPSLLGLGDIKVQSAGAEVEFTMRGIPHPEQMRDIILKYVSEGSENPTV